MQEMFWLILQTTFNGFWFYGGTFKFSFGERNDSHCRVVHTKTRGKCKFEETLKIEF